MIVLFTDFGPAGPYTGQVKAVLAQEAPAVPVIDLFADAPSRNPRAAAYLLAAYASWFPAGTVFLAVVDPGVGGARKPIVLKADGRFYVGPDNGLLELVARRAGPTRFWQIIWQPRHLSTSFHGRDLFAPVAAKLARGAAIDSLARATAPQRFDDWPDDLAEIIYVDSFGNAMTGLRAGSVPQATTLQVRDRAVGHARTFSAVPQGEAFWFENSNGLVEIAVNGGRAADAELKLAIGTPISVASGGTTKTQPKRMQAGYAKKPRPGREPKSPAKTGNPRLTEQTRKVLGKHYANKYRVK